MPDKLTAKRGKMRTHRTYSSNAQTMQVHTKVAAMSKLRFEFQMHCLCGVGNSKNRFDRSGGNEEMPDFSFCPF